MEDYHIMDRRPLCLRTDFVDTNCAGTEACDPKKQNDKMTNQQIYTFLKSLSSNYPYGIPKVTLEKSASIQASNNKVDNNFITKPKKTYQYRAIFITKDLNLISPEEQELFNNAITKGLKFAISEVVLTDVKSILAKTANIQLKDAEKIVLLGSEVNTQIADPDNKELKNEIRDRILIATHSLAEVIASQEIKKQFWNDIKKCL